jgi:(S)-3,5-dihydroxyphenylglycine transaminase
VNGAITSKPAEPPQHVDRMKLSPHATVINFLNEVADEFPSAISLAAGRPTDRFFGRLNPESLLRAVSRYQRHISDGEQLVDPTTRLLQYGRTAGIIPELIAQQLRVDEGVTSASERMLVTAGCQEAITLCVSALCPDPSDAVLVCNPTYGGATGAARASRVSVFPVPNNVSDFVEGIERSASQLQKSSRRVRALYLIPNFDNPTGRVLDEFQRRAILALCARLRIVVLEDNAYGMFRYEGQSVKPMAALDEAGSVVYLSTFSKTLAPGLRVGAISLPETLFGEREARRALWHDLVQRKSFLTTNTNQISQAIVGGILLEQNGSLQQWIAPALGWYRNNRDAMLSQLDAVFAPVSDQIRWNRPAGGFFLSLNLPFRFGADAVTECAMNYGVIVMPMSFFALDDSQDQRVRLAFSGTDSQRIRAGVTALARYVAERMGCELPVSERLERPLMRQR